MYNEAKLKAALDGAIQELGRQGRPDPFADKKTASENRENAAIKRQIVGALEAILELDIVKTLELSKPR